MLNKEMFEEYYESKDIDLRNKNCGRASLHGGYTYKKNI